MSDKYDGCLITLKNELKDWGYIAKFKIISIIIKADKEEYEKTLE
jgi:hypothetical protein